MRWKIHPRNLEHAVRVRFYIKNKKKREQFRVVVHQQHRSARPNAPDSWMRAKVHKHCLQIVGNREAIRVRERKKKTE